LLISAARAAACLWAQKDSLAPTRWWHYKQRVLQVLLSKHQFHDARYYRGRHGAHIDELFMTKNLSIPHDRAFEMSRKVISVLKRWRK
jgi:hypothetical protein